MESYFATCPKGLEDLLFEELSSFGVESPKRTVAGIAFKANLEAVCKVLIGSRLASRIIWSLKEAEVNSVEDLYTVAYKINWLNYFTLDSTFIVDATVSGSVITHNRYASQKVKDAVCDRFRKKTDRRPSVKKDQPDVHVNVVVKGNKAMIGLDLSGDPLHRRGYRQGAGEAPIKENLAAAILLRAGWGNICKDHPVMIDPMCGSGTFLIEGAMIAGNVAPGLNRQYFGIKGLLAFDQGIWKKVRNNFQQRADSGIARLIKSGDFRGYDAHGGVLGQAGPNARMAGLGKVIHFSKRSIDDWSGVTGEEPKMGLLIANPPYGERMGNFAQLNTLHARLGQLLATRFRGWHASIFTGNPALCKQMGIRAHKVYKLFNGSIPCELLNFEIKEDRFMHAHEEGDNLSPAAQDFRNRLKKNLKQIQKWAKREGLDSYRVYDADLPDYNVAIDRYGHYVVVQEYRAPAEISTAKASRRLGEVLRVVPECLEIPEERLVLKQRQRQKGKSQYERFQKKEKFLEMKESDFKFLVNLHDYLDTGLFNDHRPLRKRIRESCQEKTFLNLFCYTGTASVYAAAGGASRTTSVDMSKTYLDWALKNMKLNGFSGSEHRYIQADCSEWLEQTSELYDIIYLDPPTFSNSKRMDNTFEIQRDFPDLLAMTIKHLAPGGTLFFSNNFREFKMDQKITDSMGLVVENITKASIPKDYTRNQKIHHCWIIRRKEQ